jgi:hypothetical protein
MTQLSLGLYEICFEFNPQRVRRGVHIVKARLQFDNGTKRVVVTHKLKAILGAPEDHVELKPTSRYKKPKKMDDRNWHRRKMLCGTRAVSNADFRGLPYYDISEDYRGQFDINIRRPGSLFSLQSLLQSKLPIELNVNTYKTHWTHLLWHEELQTE